MVLVSHLCSQSLLRYELGSNRASHTTAECWTSCSRVRQASPGRQLDEGLQHHLCLCHYILSSKPFWFQQDLSFLKSPWLDPAIIALMCRCVKKRWKGKGEAGTRKNERMGKQWWCCLPSLPSFPFKDTYLFAVVLLWHCLWSAGIWKLLSCRLTFVSVPAVCDSFSQGLEGRTAMKLIIFQKGLQWCL